MPTVVDEVRDDGSAQLDSISVEVSDLPRSISFLRTLGVVVPAAGGDAAFGSLRLPRFRVDWVAATAPPLDIRLGVRCAEPSDVDRVARVLREAGHLVRRRPVDEPWGSRTALLVDPDGHLVELYAPYP